VVPSLVLLSLVPLVTGLVADGPSSLVLSSSALEVLFRPELNLFHTYMPDVLSLVSGKHRMDTQNELSATNALSSVGILCMIIPLYQAELAHPSIRGRVTALQQFMLGIGALCAAWISYGTYIGFAPTDSGQWRTPLGIQVIPAVFLAALIMIFPESPRWLIDHGKVELGLKTLAKLHAHGDENDPWVQAEFQQIQDTITFEHEHEAKSYVELFTDRSCFRRVFLACAIQGSVQMTGVSAIQYYSVEIYGQMGIKGDDTLKYQAISSIIALIAQALCILLIDKFGRRWPLILGNLGNMVTFIISCILLAVFPPGSSNNSAAAWGFIVITWVYNFSFSATCGPLSWIIPAEIFDTKTRSKGVSLATMVSFGLNTMIGQVTGIAMENIGWKYYLLFVVSITQPTSRIQY
jgi:sugar porter (SP) family MFS transporter